MDAANPLCRFLMLAVGLLAVLGCKSDASGERVRAQMPQDPLAPIAPPPMPPPASGTPYSATPIVPSTPTPPSGVVPAIPGAPVVGSPVPPSAKGPVVPVSGVKNLATATDLLKHSVPRVKVVAIVGASNVITDQEVFEAVVQHYDELAKFEGQARDAKQKEMYTIALRHTIQRELILDEMYSKLKKAGKANVIDEIREGASQMADRQVREMKKKTGAKTDDELSMILHLQGLTLPVLRRQWEREIMAHQYTQSILKEKGRRVGFGEIRAYYDKNQNEFKTPDRVKWQHIFISFTKHATQRAAYDYAEALRQKLVAGADFAATSKAYDNGLASGQNGFGTGEKPGEIAPADLAPTVWDLKPGQMSGLLQTPTGYHIVKVVERDYGGVKPFDPKLQNEIRDKLNDKVFREDEAKMVEELWRKGTVRVIAE